MERDSSARRSHLVENSRDQLETSLSNLYRDQLQTNHPVESSATNNPPCREIS